jgi:hypothetical protein
MPSRVVSCVSIRFTSMRSYEGLIFNESGRGVRQPYYRMAADSVIALGDVGPIGIFEEPDEYSRRALVCPFSQHDFVTFAEFRNRCSSFRHFVISFFEPGGAGQQSPPPESSSDDLATIYWLGVLPSSRAEYLFSKSMSFAAVAGTRCFLVTMSRFSSRFP